VDPPVDAKKGVDGWMFALFALILLIIYGSFLNFTWPWGKLQWWYGAPILINVINWAVSFFTYVCIGTQDDKGGHPIDAWKKRLNWAVYLIIDFLSLIVGNTILIYFASQCSTVRVSWIDMALLAALLLSYTRCLGWFILRFVETGGRGK
jgi:hypothetical protein